jgi:hypothetical protein
VLSTAGGGSTGGGSTEGGSSSRGGGSGFGAGGIGSAATILERSSVTEPSSDPIATSDRPTTRVSAAAAPIQIGLRSRDRARTGASAGASAVGTANGGVAGVGSIGTGKAGGVDATIALAELGGATATGSIARATTVSPVRVGTTVGVGVGVGDGDGDGDGDAAVDVGTTVRDGEAADVGTTVRDIDGDGAGGAGLVGTTVRDIDGDGDAADVGTTVRDAGAGPGGGGIGRLASRATGTTTGSSSDGIVGRLRTRVGAPGSCAGGSTFAGSLGARGMPILGSGGRNTAREGAPPPTIVVVVRGVPAPSVRLDPFGAPSLATAC